MQLNINSNPSPPFITTYHPSLHNLKCTLRKCHILLSACNLLPHPPTINFFHPPNLYQLPGRTKLNSLPPPPLILLNPPATTPSLGLSPTSPITFTPMPFGLPATSYLLIQHDVFYVWETRKSLSTIENGHWSSTKISDNLLLLVVVYTKSPQFSFSSYWNVHQNLPLTSIKSVAVILNWQINWFYSHDTITVLTDM